MARPVVPVMTPLNSPVHGALVATSPLRSRVLRLKSKPASKLDGAFSPTNCGSNEEESVANRPWMFAGGSLKLSLAT